MILDSNSISHKYQTQYFPNFQFKKIKNDFFPYALNINSQRNLSQVINSKTVSKKPTVKRSYLVGELHIEEYEVLS